MSEQAAAAMAKWLALPEKHREEVLGNLRVDHESWDGNDESQDEYPEESKIRANATMLAIEVLGGKV